MNKKPPIFYIFILFIFVEVFAGLLLWLTLRNSPNLLEVLYGFIIVAISVDIVLLSAIELAKDYLKNEEVVLLTFFRARIQNFRQIRSIGIAKLKQRYKGSALGWSWAIIRPAINIFVYWFAIDIGLRSGYDVDGYPYYLWLMVGFIPWFYMRDMITYGAGCFRNNAYLLKVAKYPIITIPAITNISLIPVHIGLVFLMTGVFLVTGHGISIHIIQLPIYMVLMFVFFDFWGLFAGVMSAVSKDFMNLVNSLVTAVMWLSGIFYNVQTFNNVFAKLVFSFNPVTILVTGYRHCFIDHIWFYEDIDQLFNFFLLLMIMMLLAVRAYKKFGKILPDLL